MQRKQRKNRQLRAERRQCERKQQALRSQLRASLRIEQCRVLLSQPAHELQATVDELDENKDMSCWAPPKKEMVEVLHDKAPRLLSRAHYGALCAIAAQGGWHRPLDSWYPTARASGRQFAELCQHLYADYPTPGWLWSVWSDPNRQVLAPVVIRVARGDSLHDLSRAGVLPVPLSRAQAHELLQLDRPTSLTRALRMVQVRSAGGDVGLLDAWMRTPFGSGLGSREDEQFWSSVLGWFARQRVRGRQELAGLAEYLCLLRREPGFRMKGRTLDSLRRRRDEWLQRMKQDLDVSDAVFPASGLDEARLVTEQRLPGGARLTRTWEFRELRTARALVADGRKMHHCVGSYVAMAQRGERSLWSLWLDDLDGARRLLTIDVLLRTRRVVQVRGKFNRLPDRIERKIVARWAIQNGLTNE